MDSVHTLLHMIDLCSEVCQLNHGKYPQQRAVDFLTIPIGKLGQPDLDIRADYNIEIPVCLECAKTLTTINSRASEWVLYLCLYCGNTAWRIKQLIRYDVHGIVMSDGCPECSNMSYASWNKF